VCGVCNGAQMARLRQSSAVDPLKFSCVTTSLSIEALIPGIWGQAGPRAVEITVFWGWDKACGGRKRRLFSGGWAYGMYVEKLADVGGCSVYEADYWALS